MLLFNLQHFIPDKTGGHTDRAVTAIDVVPMRKPHLPITITFFNLNHFYDRGVFPHHQPLCTRSSPTAKKRSIHLTQTNIETDGWRMDKQTDTPTYRVPKMRQKRCSILFNSHFTPTLSPTTLFLMNTNQVVGSFWSFFIFSHDSPIDELEKIRAKSLFMFVHVCSCLFMFVHVYSCLFMFVHVLPIALKFPFIQNKIL